MQIAVKLPKNKSDKIKLDFKDLVKLYNLKNLQESASDAYNMKPNILMKKLDFSDWLVFSIYDKEGLRISGGTPLREIKDVIKDRELIGINYHLESNLFNLVYESNSNTEDRIVLSAYSQKGAIPFFVYHFLD